MQHTFHLHSTLKPLKKQKQSNNTYACTERENILYCIFHNIITLNKFNSERREKKTKQRMYIKSRNNNPLLYSRLFIQKKKKKKKAISYHKKR